MLKLTQILEHLAVRGKFVAFFFFSVHCIKQTDSKLQWVCSVIDHRGRQNVVKISVILPSTARVPLRCFYHCDLLLNRRMATWNLFVKGITKCDDCYKFATLHTLSSFMPDVIFC